MKKHIITSQEYAEVKEAAKRNKHKRVDKRLQVIIMRYEGKKDHEIGDKLGYSRKRISQLCAEFKTTGLNEYMRLKYTGNRRALPISVEREILSGFKEKAIQGELVTAKTIKATFDEKRGKDTGRGYIYRLLARHKWRMVMPRGQHPQKASESEIEDSKNKINAPEVSV